jgi:hypothetical protein
VLDALHRAHTLNLPLKVSNVFESLSVNRRLPTRAAPSLVRALRVPRHLLRGRPLLNRRCGDPDWELIQGLGSALIDCSIGLGAPDLILPVVYCGNKGREPHAHKWPQEHFSGLLRSRIEG